jgi:flagellar protein FlaG
MSIQPLSGPAASVTTPTTGVRSNALAASPTAHTDGADTIQASDKAQRPPENTLSVGKEALKEATHRANQAIAGLGSDLKFTIDEDTGVNVVKFIDVSTKEVIRQIPAQEMLEISKRLDELQGLLIKERA